MKPLLSRPKTLKASRISSSEPVSFILRAIMVRQTVQCSEWCGWFGSAEAPSQDWSCGSSHISFSQRLQLDARNSPVPRTWRNKVRLHEREIGDGGRFTRRTIPERAFTAVAGGLQCLRRRRDQAYMTCREVVRHVTLPKQGVVVVVRAGSKGCLLLLLLLDVDAIEALCCCARRRSAGDVCKCSKLCEDKRCCCCNEPADMMEMGMMADV
jgi:hypothetical protein